MKNETTPSGFIPAKTFKTAKTIKPYTTTYDGNEITIPAGSIVSNKTAMGYDDRLRFWQDFRKTVGERNFALIHDLTYYGINVPAEYCEPYKTD